MPTHKAIAVAQGNNKVFTATQNEVIVYDINDESLSYLQKGRELTEINISHINYNEEKNILIIGYNSGNIDLIIDERTINLPALKNATIIGNKKIANSTFYAEKIFVSTGVGVLELSLEKFEVSKSHNMAGWRIGWITGREDYLKEILKVKSNMDSGMFKPMQLAAVTALNNSKEWHEKQNANYAERRELVWQLFDQLKCTYSREQVGLFIWAKLPETIEDNEAFVEDILQKAHVFITPGFIFGNKGDRYLRISLCANQETLIEVNQRIENYINKV